MRPNYLLSLPCLCKTTPTDQSIVSLSMSQPSFYPHQNILDLSDFPVSFFVLFTQQTFPFYVNINNDRRIPFVNWSVKNTTGNY